MKQLSSTRSYCHEKNETNSQTGLDNSTLKWMQHIANTILSFDTNKHNKNEGPNDNNNNNRKKQNIIPMPVLMLVAIEIMLLLVLTKQEESKRDL